MWRQGMSNSTSDRIRVILYWIVGAALSVVVMWRVCDVFCTTPFRLKLWREGLQRNTYPMGFRYQYRREGWGTSYYGKYGINGIRDVTSAADEKLIIWGDSYVEAFQVSDEDKLAQRLTAMLRQASHKDIVAVGIGNSGQMVADYYFQIPQYENVITDVSCHFILIVNADDILPDRSSALHAEFLSEPVLRFVPERQKPRKLTFEDSMELSTKVNRIFYTRMRQSVLGLWSGLRFGVGPVSEASGRGDPPGPDTGDLPEIFSFLLRSLKARTSHPITFVYCPYLPYINQGTVVCSDEQASTLEVFRETCARLGVGFIDMAPRFVDFYENTGRLPRGFHSSRPGGGHFNEDGHQLIAEAIFSYLTETEVAFLSD